MFFVFVCVDAVTEFKLVWSPVMAPVFAVNCVLIALTLFWSAVMSAVCVVTCVENVFTEAVRAASPCELVLTVFVRLARISNESRLSFSSLRKVDNL